MGVDSSGLSTTVAFGVSLIAMASVGGVLVREYLSAGR